MAYALAPLANKRTIKREYYQYPNFIIWRFLIINFYYLEVGI